MINAATMQVIQLVKELSEAAKLPYALPTKLTQELFQKVDEAVARVGNQSK